MANFIDNILNYFEQYNVINLLGLHPYVEWLIYMLIIFDLAMSYKIFNQKEFFLKVFRYGYLITIVYNFQDIIRWFIA